MSLVVPLGHAGAHTYHPHQLRLHNAADAFNLVPLIARAELRARRPLVPHGIKMHLVRSLPEIGSADSRILSVAISLVLTLLGADAGVFATADNTAIAFANARTQAAEDFTIMGAPFPDAENC